MIEEFIESGLSAFTIAHKYGVSMSVFWKAYDEYMEAKGE